ncbi:PEP-CTERM sorting domain-containing protein [Aliiglaciecola sp. CAU 1673]|uniref:PEP-CTERM sorting domain-containing protein n=1 Tax=Aliiglaciecola sp. CAU 1673 TaxID=3032595 RepID=UPI0023DC9352|nr:PEP-CTERM sorting domain-containing protein [Aliiglaciecola sp. CAU 1673]MDF2177870.1 PEP-CTERM sorting domain-containing protein [Aliiglaciecola sp. CAU 1673]
MKNMKSSALVLAAFLVPPIASATHIEVETKISVNDPIYLGWNSGFTGPAYDLKQNDTGLLENSLLSYSSPGLQVSAFSSAKTGTIKAKASAFGGNSVGGNSQVRAYSQDSFTVSNEFYKGKKGEITVAFYLEYDILQINPEILGPGEGSGGVIGGGIWFDANLGGSRVNYSHYVYRDYYGENHDNKGIIYDGTFNGSVFLLTTEFIFGQSIWYSNHMGLTASASGFSSNSYGISIDASNSSYWAGIQSVIIDGEEITDYQLSSESGTDYSRSFVPTPSNPNPVPEPESLLLMSLGFLGLFVKRFSFFKSKKSFK